MSPRNFLGINHRLAEDIFLRHKDVLFWVFFTLLGISSLLLYARAVNSDVIIPIIVIAMGIAKLGEEMVSKRIRHQQAELNCHLDRVSKWLEDNYSFVMGLKSSHESHQKAISQMGEDHVKFDSKLQRSYRELAGKIIEIENSLNKLSKTSSVHQQALAHFHKSAASQKAVKELEKKLEKLTIRDNEDKKRLAHLHRSLAAHSNATKKSRKTLAATNIAKDRKLARINSKLTGQAAAKANV